MFPISNYLLKSWLISAHHFLKSASQRTPLWITGHGRARKFKKLVSKFKAFRINGKENTGDNSIQY
jgi:hypothetical protein